MATPQADEKTSKMVISLTEMALSAASDKNGYEPLEAIWAERDIHPVRYIWRWAAVLPVTAVYDTVMLSRLKLGEHPAPLSSMVIFAGYPKALVEHGHAGHNGCINHMGSMT